MRIILSNYRYFISGGPEKYMFSVKKLLEESGHSIFPFSVKYPMNEKTKWEKYFVSPISSGESDYFLEYKKNLSTALKIIERNIYSFEVYKKAEFYALRTNADIVYSLHFMNKLSPSLIDGFKAVQMPLVARLSDFSLICPQQSMFHGDRICTDCMAKGLFSCIRKRCVHNSYIGSLIKVISLIFHNYKKTFDKIDAFICPSDFLRKKYMEAGFDKNKLIHLPTFVEIDEHKNFYQPSKISIEKYILYIGRVTKEKGVEVLLKAWKLLNEKRVRLLIVGNTRESAYSKRLQTEYGHIAEFYDFMKPEKIRKIIQNSLIVVVPSMWYENMPNVVLEAFSLEKPIIASNIGSLPEIVEDGINGKLFTPGNYHELALLLNEAINNEKTYKEMGKQAKIICKQKYSKERHLNKLLMVFNNLVKNQKKGK